MLYVSRVMGFGKYGVVDTDDGVEEVAKRDDILDAFRCGLRVEGVDPRQGYIGVYQPDNTRTQLQIKTKMLKKVDVLTYQDMITAIYWDWEELGDKIVTIRLSEFASRCSNYLISQNKLAGTHKLTFVLDDKIKFSKDAFYIAPAITLEEFGVRLDVRECSDEVAKNAYANAYSGFMFDWHKSVIDNPERYRAICKSYEVDIP